LNIDREELRSSRRARIESKALHDGRDCGAAGEWAGSSPQQNDGDRAQLRKSVARVGGVAKKGAAELAVATAERDC